MPNAPEIPTPPASEFDVIVIGGGPAGSTTATLLAQAGCRVVLFEREKFPRYHIGESLMPETYGVFQRLGVLDRMKQSGFVKKLSVQFVSQSGRESAPFYFFETHPHESSQTWQVTRSEFDAMLLDNARRYGVDVREQARVLDVLFDGSRAVGVRVSEPGGARRGPAAEYRARVVVDASGQSSLIVNKLGLKVSDPVLRKASIWTYYRGAHRDPGVDEGATLVLSTRGKKGWFWYIPLANDIVSVGAVSSAERLFRPGVDHRTAFQRELAECPAVQRRIAAAEEVGPMRATRDFSYRAAQCAGDGWVLVGDAFGFLDPIYSSGVFLALKSGELAADAIAEGLATGNLSAAQLGSWGPMFSAGMESMRKLVYAFYTGDFSFGQFIREHPEQTVNLIDLLIGNVWREGVNEIFTAIGEQVPLPDPVPLDSPTEASNV